MQIPIVRKAPVVYKRRFPMMCFRMCATFFYRNMLDKPSQTMEKSKWLYQMVISKILMMFLVNLSGLYHGKIMVLWLGSRENHGKPRGQARVFRYVFSMVFVEVSTVTFPKPIHWNLVRRCQLKREQTSKALPAFSIDRFREASSVFDREEKKGRVYV